MRLQAIPIRSSRKSEPFSLVDLMLEDIIRAGLRLLEGDIIVISSKYVSLAEGRSYDLSNVQTVYRGERYKDKFAELVYRESEQVIGSFLNFHLSITNKVLAPNSGIDESNIRSGLVTLYPINPNLVAEKIRILVLLELGIYIGVILTDSRLYPLRQGTTGIAIGFSGIKAIIDDRGREDLFGKKLKVTKRAIVDDLASVAQLLMGESSESTPYVLIRGLDGFVERKNVDYDVVVKCDECLYVRAFSKGNK